MYVEHFLLIIRQPRMQVKFETMDLLTNTMMKIHRKIWDSKNASSILLSETIPNWSGFFSVVKEQLQQDITNVIYLPLIAEFGRVLQFTFETILFLLRTILPDTRIYYRVNYYSVNPQLPFFKYFVF